MKLSTSITTLLALATIAKGQIANNQTTVTKTVTAAATETQGDSVISSYFTNLSASCEQKNAQDLDKILTHYNLSRSNDVSLSPSKLGNIIEVRLLTKCNNSPQIDKAQQAIDKQVAQLAINEYNMKNHCKAVLIENEDIENYNCKSKNTNVAGSTEVNKLLAVAGLAGSVLIPAIL